MYLYRAQQSLIIVGRTWPAIWETKESNWPAGGEVDILEGVNDQGPNAATLHTLSGKSEIITSNHI